jgi:hypothetical protein
MYLDYSVSGLPGLYRAPSNNRMQLTGRGHRFVEGLAPPAVLRHVLPI